MLQRAELAQLFESEGLSSHDYELNPILGGANNQIYQVQRKNGLPLIVKRYFSTDQTERLSREFDFLNYAEKCCIKNVPQPVGCDPAKQLGLYSFLSGRKPCASDVNLNTVSQCSDFFLSLNQNRSLGKNLPLAVEATLCVRDYFQQVEQRIQKLLGVAQEDLCKKGLLAFLKDRLIPLWEKIQSQAEKKIAKQRMEMDQPLAQENLCITPSDFGFHNTLIDGTKIKFLDFEYAGWDDPVNTVADFFCQSAVPVPMKFFSFISERFFSVIEDKEAAQVRLDVVFLICQIRWCCIMLNVFSKLKEQQREFSKSNQNPENQLLLAKEYVKKIEDNYGI